MPWGGSGWSKSFPCDLVRFSSAWLSPAVGATGLVCPQWGVLSSPLTLENSFRLLQGLLQPSFRDPPQPDPGILARWAPEGVGSGYWGDLACLELGDSPGTPRQGWHTRTDSEAPRVEGVPGEVGHRCAILDGGQRHVGETAGLGELWDRAGGHQQGTHGAVPASRPQRVPRGRRSGRRRRAGAGPRAGGWRRSRRSRPAW